MDHKIEQNKLDKKEIFILSASDRFNYGDLLFPIIAEKALSSNDFSFFNVGCVKSDLSHKGALPTYDYNIIYRNSNSKTKKVILVAGGEVLLANWSRLYSFIWPTYFKLYERFRIKKKLGTLERFTTWFKGHRSNRYPFIPSGTRISENYRVVFNAVGGNYISSQKDNRVIQQVFRNALFFSAREQKTYRSLESNFNVPNLLLSPDSAIIMSDYYSFKKESDTEKYIAFQIGHHKNGNALDLINDQLMELSSETKLPVYFVPIGNCPGHDDMVSLQYLHKHANYNSKIIEPDNIEAIMKTIANSELFIGTSLHGVITAMSFETPYLALNPKIEKLKDYVDTWVEAPFNTIVTFNDIKKEGVTRLKCENKESILKESLQKQKDLVRHNFNEIKNRIQAL